MDAKTVMREEHLAYRRHLRTHPALKGPLDAAIVSYAVDLVASFGTSCGRINVAAYEPYPSEPGGDGLVPALAGVSRRLFLPVTLPEGRLSWVVAGGDGPRYTSRVLASCGVVFVPALGVDASGLRLGKGGGYYDRALAGLDAYTCAVVFERERVASVPAEPHDVRVRAVLSEQGVRAVEPM
ncbi:5-formyltetrahydrofolate cyclo-ligase [Corynebacterium liangguodongii]|uniref:5-formyltetrahydrofolate cyclo-ligase n=1 Tax=Corynebacterium liangguodongii TaxID=2079535 RepID=A0A2S0WD51_9CORY|nr:5-formyltetrahydrofolate cyclo-ligase [Corynebacterium liangguodongii]AWB83674.1 5-formyltetrahydrofolate cyclo-ligase [Corynebacterium liangguodongii]PWB99516.1 5-formyltetrahydrofolate cyclo-ligase [Corynebacterium liangguodongii]